MDRDIQLKLRKLKKHLTDVELAKKVIDDLEEKGVF